MKKFIAVLIAAIMAFGVVPVTAFAAEGGADSEYPYGESTEGRITIYDGDDTYYVYEEGAWESNAPEGVVYNKAKNTLTLTYVNMPNAVLYIYAMDYNFRLMINGECSLLTVTVNDYAFATNLNICGSGTLTLNKDKQADYAVRTLNGSGNKNVNIGKDVTVNFYGDKSAFYAGNVTNQTPDFVFTENRENIPDVTGEAVTDEREKEIYGAGVFHPHRSYACGTQVASKEDPDGLYTYYETDDGACYVNRYVYIPELEAYGRSMFTQESFDSKEKMEEKYDYVMEEQPVKAHFFTEETWNYRGYIAYRIASEDDPDGIYAALQDWDDEFIVNKLYWNETENYYYADNSFGQLTLTEDELAEKGFSFVYETREDKVEYSCWDNLPGTEGAYKDDYDRISCDDDPDGIYVQTGSYERRSDAGMMERGIIIRKVLFTEGDDPQPYVIIDYKGESEDEIYVSDDDMETGEAGYRYVTETRSKSIRVKYLTDSYDLLDDALSGDLWTKDSESYALIKWYSFNDDDTEEEHYNLERIVFDESKGYYFAADDGSERDVDVEELPGKGYTSVTEMQPVELNMTGMAELSSYKVYADENGTEYAVDWYNEVFTMSGETIKIDDTAYYILTPNGEIDLDSLTPVKESEPTGRYNYTYDFNEYRHEGSGEGVVYSGKTGDCDWSYDPETFTLTISGEGETGAYNEEDPAPWYDFTVKNIDIKDGVKIIRSANFADSEVQSVTIPDSVEHIGMIAFMNCRWLGELKLSKNLKSIAGGAFMGCSLLQKAELPDKLESLGPFAFGDCEDLSEITIPDSITDLGASVFQHTQWYAEQPDGPVYVGKAYYGYHGALPENTELIIKEGTVSIAAGCMSDCYPKENLARVVFPSTITKIRSMYLFNDCRNIKEFEIPAAVTDIEYGALGYYYDEEEDDLKKIEGLTIVGEKGSEAERYAKDNGFAFREKGSYILGDANGDGSVTVSDVTTVQRHTAELEFLTGDRFAAADVNKDGVVNVDDATLIQKYIAEMITEF